MALLVAFMELISEQNICNSKNQIAAAFVGEEEKGYIYRKRRQASSDLHKDTYCPKGPGEQEAIPKIQYTCTRKKEMCYKSMINDQCNKCHHSEGKSNEAVKVIKLNNGSRTHHPFIYTNK